MKFTCQNSFKLLVALDVGEKFKFRDVEYTKTDYTDPYGAIAVITEDANLVFSSKNTKVTTGEDTFERKELKCVRFGSIVTEDFIDFYLVTPKPLSGTHDIMVIHNIRTGYARDFDWNTVVYIVEKQED